MLAFYDPGPWRGQCAPVWLIAYCSLEPAHKRWLTLTSQFEMHFPYYVRSETDNDRSDEQGNQRGLRDGWLGVGNETSGYSDVFA